MAVKPEPVTLRTRYTDQAMADLEENRRRQAELLSHLEVLKQEEVLLLDIINLTGPSPTESPSSTLHSQQELSTDSSATRRGARASDEPSPEAQLHEPDVPRKPEGRKGGGSHPLLREILVELLSAHSEPRAAKDVWRECREKHPDRSPSNQVVRNTLEGLVARGAVDRHKQGHTVMYSLARAAD